MLDLQPAAQPPKKPTGPVPQASASVFRGVVSSLKRLGLLEAVLPQLSPRVQALVASPPVFEWVNLEDLDSITVKVFEIHGAGKVRAVTYETTKRSLGPIVQPLIQTLFRLLGKSPGSLMSNIGKASALFNRGVTPRYTPTGPTSGRLDVHLLYAAHRAVFIAWEGSIQYAFDLCGVTGSVGRNTLADDMKSCSIEFEWGGKPNGARQSAES